MSMPYWLTAVVHSHSIAIVLKLLFLLPYEELVAGL